MNKLKILLPILLILALLLAVPAMAEEAEDLTAGLTVKVVDKPGKIKAITDGSYKSFWESSNRKEPWVVLSSDKPIYGLYLCFQKMPDSFVIEKASGDDWVTVAEGVHNGKEKHHGLQRDLCFRTGRGPGLGPALECARGKGGPAVPDRPSG